MRRVLAASVCGALLLAGCFGGGDGEEEAASLPLPDQPPATAGPAAGPAMEAKALFTSADALEEQVGAVDTAQVERRSGALISGTTAVGYSVDDISGYDLDSGDQLWTAPLDLGGGTVCFVSEPDRDVEYVTVVHGEGGYCPEVATIRVSDGEVVKESSALSDLPEFEGEPAGGSVNDLFTVEGKDYLLDMQGVVWRMAEGEPEAVAKLEDRSYFDLHVSPDGSSLVGSRLSDPQCRIDSYDLPTFEHQWTTDGAEAFPDQEEDCVVSSAPGDPTWLLQQIGTSYHMAKLDPETGDPVGETSAPTSSEGPVPEGTFDVASAGNQFDRTMGIGDGEMIVAQARGLSRYSLGTKEMAWELDLTQLELPSDDDNALTTVLPQGLTDDGLIVATVSNNTAAEVIAVDAEKGTLVGRWAVPEEYRNGFQVEPGATLYDGGLVLTRNFEAWEFAFADYLDAEPPEGDRFDIGVFTFPPPEESVEPEARAVPTAGPVDLEAEPLAAVEADDPDVDVPTGAVHTGDAIVTYSGNRLASFDESGKELWTQQLGDDPAARVCSTSEPDRGTKAIAIAYRPEEGGKCTALLRVGAKGGTVQDVDLGSSPPVARVETQAGEDYVVTEGGVVSTIVDGALERVADLGRSPVFWERTPQDPSLVVTSSRIGGDDWVVEGWRAPTFEKVWSTRAGTIFGRKPGKDNFASPWAGNGLWVSASFGTYDGPDSDVRDALVTLDPATGEVVATTGVKKRDYLADDLEAFSLTAAATGGADTVGFEDGSVVLEQGSGIMRYSLEDDAILWSVDTSSIRTSMETRRQAGTPSETYRLVDGGATVLVTLTNTVSTELMTIAADDGTVIGRWKIGEKERNGLQAGPDVTAWTGGVALVRYPYSWLSSFGPDAPNEPPKGPVHDIGLFRLEPQKGEE